MKKIINKLPYWLRGMLIPPILVLVLWGISYLSFLVGFGSGIPLFAYLGFFIVFILALPSMFIGASIIEIINYYFGLNIKGSEGGGSPTLIVQLITLFVFVIVFALVFHIYGKIKMKKSKAI